MLKNLHIKNLALIREIDIDFTEGLNILTGETGAGKSIIIDSITLALGGKTPRNLLREDAPYGLVELVFLVNDPETIEALRAVDVEPEDAVAGLRIAYASLYGGSAQTVVIPSCSFSEARKLVAAAELKAKRARVHELSQGRLGYLNIDEMNWASFWTFQHEVFSEGYGKDGLVIDVRNNQGGFTADQMLQILLGGDHSRAVTRQCGAGYLFGYWGRPVWSKPIVVLANENTGSNGEIFSHAIKTLKRGKLVGRETGGGVIGTYDNALLDLGSFRDARYGWFLLDGTDMENHGAKPDVVVEDLPGDLDRGLDVQLDKAIEVLAADVEAWRAANPPIDFKYSR